MPTQAAHDPWVVRVTGFGAEPGSRRNAVAAVARELAVGPGQGWVR